MQLCLGCLQEKIMMSFSNNFVFVVLCNGKPIREFAEENQRTAILPFDSEYSIRLKNKGKKRAKAKIYIDGVDICSTPDMGFVILPNETIDIERFVDSFKEGKKFKFVSVEENQDKISDPTSLENGIIRVEFFEEDVAHTIQHSITPGIFPHNYNYPNRPTDYDIKQWQEQILRQITYSTTGTSLTNSSSSTSTTLPTNGTNSSGATVEGSGSQQIFSAAPYFKTSSMPTIISIKLKAPSVESSEEDNKIIVVASKGKLEVYLEKVLLATSKDAGTTISLTDTGLKVKSEGITLDTKHYTLKTAN
jgi:hypothetical protein